MAQEDTVNDAMIGGALTTTADVRIADAARMMRDADVAIIAVVDDDEELIGVITDRDITIVVADELDPSTTRVGERMSDSPVSVGQNDDLDAAFERMLEGDVHRAPVTDEVGHVWGVLEQSDAARHGEGRRVADSGGQHPR
ncbi:MAG: putative signal-transduction protein with domain [Actinomycetia bacterium]|nr:putative signal-transduction protein with domain [Actinomycetes bacterium]